MTIPAHNEDTAFELDHLRELAKREGFSYATMKALGMAEASTRFLAEILGSATVAKQLSSYLGHGMENAEQMVSLSEHPMPDILALARPPEFWSEAFAAAGIRMSARAIREKALKAGLCYYADKNVLITPAQVDALFIWRGNQAAKSPSPASAGGHARRAYLKAMRALEQSKADRAKNRKKQK